MVCELDLTVVEGLLIGWTCARVAFCACLIDKFAYGIYMYMYSFSISRSSLLEHLDTWLTSDVKDCVINPDAVVGIS